LPHHQGAKHELRVLQYHVSAIEAPVNSTLHCRDSSQRPETGSRWHTKIQPSRPLTVHNKTFPSCAVLQWIDQRMLNTKSATDQDGMNSPQEDKRSSVVTKQASKALTVNFPYTYDCTGMRQESFQWSSFIAIYFCANGLYTQWRKTVSMSFRLVDSVPSKKILHWAKVCSATQETHATAQPCRHINQWTAPKVERALRYI